MKLIGYWMSKKKSQKLNWTEFSDVCHRHGFQLKEIDLDISLESQGPFSVLLHKLTDIIVLAEQNDIYSQSALSRIENYIKHHPQLIVLDPLDNVRLLLDRSQSYSIIKSSHLTSHGIFTPTFVELVSTDKSDNIMKLKEAGIQYPFVCKPLVAHGSEHAHKMSIIFNENNISDCKPPCVAQCFINHNAVLYKIFIVGDRYYVVERPSLKNFHASNRETIFFDSHDISKANSNSSLCILDPEDKNIKTVKPEIHYFESIVLMLRKTLGMALFGVDVIIENETGKYGIIDINAFPGYDGYPNFFNDLIICISDLVQSNSYSLSTDCNTKQDNQINDSSSLLNRKHILQFKN